MSVSSLCQACGLCCNGTLFAYVTLSPDEAQALIDRDVAVGMRKDGHYRLPQRCSALDGTRCTVYEARPHGCRAYVCQLATALEQNEVGLEDAMKTVQDAHRLLAALQAELPPGEATSAVHHVRRSLAGEEPALSDAAQHAWERAREFLRRHFTGRHGLT